MLVNKHHLLCESTKSKPRKIETWSHFIIFLKLVENANTKLDTNMQYFKNETTSPDFMDLKG